MYRQYGDREVVAREIEGHFRPGRDRIVTPSKFGAVCKVLWPEKTAAHIAAIGKVDERTAKRWLANEFEPPVSVALAIFQKIFERV